MRFLLIMVIFNIHTLNGMDSDRVLVSDTLTSIIDSVCVGFPYVTPEGIEYYAEGTYIDTFPLGPTCDSVRILILNHREKLPEININMSYCYDVPDVPQNGTYLIEVEGCDPDTVLNVTIFPPQPAITTNHIMCEGQTYTWDVNGMEYSDVGTYLDTIQDANGCDQLAVLSLATRPVPPFPTSDTIVCSTTFDQYPVGTTPVFHCDSVYYVTVIDYDPITYSDSISICDGQSYLGKDETGSYIIEMPTPEGCKDILILHLRVEGVNVETSEEVSICQGEIYNGYFESGIYTDSLSSIYGCDSVHTLELTVFPVTEGYDSTYCSNPLDPNAPAPGTYASTEIDANGCEVINTLTVFPGTENMSLDTLICEDEEYLGFTEAGNYTIPQVDSNGCPYDLLLSLGIIPLADCSVPVKDETEESIVQVTPNPARDIIQIRTERSDVIMDIINGQGELLIEGIKLDPATTMNISSWDKGIYFIRLDLREQGYVTNKLIKL